MTRRFAILCAVLAGIAAAQGGQQPSEAGIPVTDPLVVAKCGSCHSTDSQGNMQRLSWSRSTPEGWEDALKQMILLHGVQVTPVEARAIVKYLGGSHGLAPDEAEPILYEPERRIHDESGALSMSLRDACAKCHSMARVLSWRRSGEEWKQFTASHATRYNVRSTDEALTFLAGAAPLHSPAWDARISRAATRDLAGRWLVTASMPGHGAYYGEMRLERDGEGEYNTQATLTSVKDGARLARSGRALVFGGYAWRGRSKGTGNSAPDSISSEAKEVMSFAANQSAGVGRWFWGQYQEFGFDVRFERATSAPTLLMVDRPSLKKGSRANRVRLIGENLPSQVAPADLNFGPGVTVSQAASVSSHEIAADLDVAAGAQLGLRSVAFRASSLPDALAVYDRIDYIKITPDSTVAAFGGRTRPRGYQQFDAIAYQRGPDGRLHTADDVPLGPVEVTWAVQVFHDPEGASSERVGSINVLGLFTPAERNPGANFDVWVIATAKDEKDANGAPFVGKSYLVVTVPEYTFNGRRYVRELDRWVDDGPAR